MLIMLKRVEHSLASSRMPSNTSTSLRDSTQPPTRSFSHTSTSDAVAVLGFRAIRLKLLVAPLHSLPPRPSRLHDSHSLQAGSSNTASSTARFMATAARADRPCIAGRVPPKPTRQQLRTATRHATRPICCRQHSPGFVLTSLAILTSRPAWPSKKPL